MAHREDWQREAHEAVRREMWTLRGFNQIVKVVASTAPATSTMGGYITLGKYLINKTPSQIEKTLA
jgi:hypothetical protein